MIRRTVRRSLVATLATLALLLSAQTGCTTSYAVQNSARPAVIYFAAVEDYNIAKASALVYIQQPSTSLTVSETILREVVKADNEIHRIEESDGRITRVRCYCFCPDTLRVVADRLGLQALPRPYRSPG